MLDESLPTFLLRPSQQAPKISSTFLFSQHGTEFSPQYVLKYLDPAAANARNQYACALYDAHSPDVLYAEVLLQPTWTQPTLSAEEIRRNGGVTPAPEPGLPAEFIVQLYNPDTQIQVRHRPGGMTAAAHWEFDIPQHSFRMPSASTLDRGQDDPTISELTPKLALKWKREGRLNKDLACYISGRATNPYGTKNKHREPDITIAIFRQLREITIYEPNLSRAEVEDAKGFEVALLLSSVVIRDVYFGNIKEAFNISRPISTSTSPVPISTPIDPLILPPRQQSGSSKLDRPPPMDPRTKWELDQETARLKKQADLEARQQAKRDQAEQKQIKEMLEDEERARRKRQAVVDAETERLRRIYGQEDISARPQVQQSWSGGNVPGGSAYSHMNISAGDPNVYMSAVTGSASNAYLGTPEQQQQQGKQKSSIFGFRRHGGDDGKKLNKQRSTAW